VLLILKIRLGSSFVFQPVTLPADPGLYTISLWQSDNPRGAVLWTTPGVLVLLWLEHQIPSELDDPALSGADECALHSLREYFPEITQESTLKVRALESNRGRRCTANLKRSPKTSIRSNPHDLVNSKRENSICDLIRAPWIAESTRSTRSDDRLARAPTKYNHSSLLS